MQGTNVLQEIPVILTRVVCFCGRCYIFKIYLNLLLQRGLYVVDKMVQIGAINLIAREIKAQARTMGKCQCNVKKNTATKHYQHLHHHCYHPRIVIILRTTIIV